MNASRPDEHVPDLLGPAALGLLTSPERRALDAHLTGCATCRRELESLEAVAMRMGDLPAEDALDLGAEARRADAVLAAIAVDAAAQRRRGQRLQAVLAAAASVAVLASGVVTAAALTRDRSPAMPLETVAVDAGTGVDATAALVAHTWGVEIRLAASGFAAGQPYRVQVVTAGGRVVEAGAFLGTGAQTLTCNLNASVLRGDATSFVVRDARGAQVLTADL